MAKTNEEALLGIIIDFFSSIKYLFLSKEEKYLSNLKLVQQRYWFQHLEEKQPSIIKRIEEDKEIKNYLSSRKKVKKLFREKEERDRFKNWLENID